MTCGDTQISAGDLRRQIQKMSLVAPGKTTSEFQYQFKILEQVSPNPNEVNCSSALRHKNLNRGIQYLPSKFLDFRISDLYVIICKRFFNNSTVENHRVFLKGQDPGRDYINAVFVNVILSVFAKFMCLQIVTQLFLNWTFATSLSKIALDSSGNRPD